MMKNSCIRFRKKKARNHKKIDYNVEAIPRSFAMKSVLGGRIWAIITIIISC